MTPDQELATLEATVREIRRPDRKLMQYYFLRSLLLGPLFPLFIVPLFFRYRSLRYGFDREGISMRWGILFRREINLTYARIQDIHLRSGVIERHLGLARVEIQTASGSAAAEMTIEGVLEFEAVRDYLYGQMRALAGSPAVVRDVASAVDPTIAGDPQLVGVLRAVTEEIRGLRADLRAAGAREEGGQAE